jgi:hypothetical protein
VTSPAVPPFRPIPNAALAGAQAPRFPGLSSLENEAGTEGNGLQAPSPSPLESSGAGNGERNEAERLRSLSALARRHLLAPRARPRGFGLLTADLAAGLDLLDSPAPDPERLRALKAAPHHAAARPELRRIGARRLTEAIRALSALGDLASLALGESPGLCLRAFEADLRLAVGAREVSAALREVRFLHHAT